MGAAILVRRKSPCKPSAVIRAFQSNSLARRLSDRQSHREKRRQNRALPRRGGLLGRAPIGWCDAWKHQLRWARTISRVHAHRHIFQYPDRRDVLVVALVCCGAHCDQNNLCTADSDRFCAHPHCARTKSSARRFLESRTNSAPFWLVPAKDLLQVFLWAGAFCGNQIEWRGKKMRLRAKTAIWNRFANNYISGRTSTL